VNNGSFVKESDNKYVECKLYKFISIIITHCYMLSYFRLLSIEWSMLSRQPFYISCKKDKRSRHMTICNTDQKKSEMKILMQDVIYLRKNAQFWNESPNTGCHFLFSYLRKKNAQFWNSSTHFNQNLISHYIYCIFQTFCSS